MKDKVDDRRRFERIRAKLRLKFQSMEAFRSEYTRNISREGIFVKTDNPLPFNEIVEVTLELPPPQPAVTLSARVVHVVKSREAEERGTEPGMGLHFVDLDGEKRFLLEGYIEQLLENEPVKTEPDRRDHYRKKLQINVKFASGGALKQKYTRDLSKGGIVIETKNPPSIDSVLKVILIHPTTGEELQLQSRVIRHVKQKDGSIAGMAITFINFEDRKNDIEHFVSSVQTLDSDDV